MRRLVNRQQQIPGGFRFSLPEIKYNSAPFSSFDVIVNSVTGLVNSNPNLARQYNWPVTRDAVADWVESVQVQICEMNGWNKYITPTGDSAPPPKHRALSPLDQKQLAAVANKVKKVWQGVKTINDWIEAGGEPVSAQLSERRAQTCVKCPLNGKGGLEEWFTKPASEAIRKQFERLKGRNLNTSVDDKLGVCTPCICPLKLKVHAPLEHIKAHLSEEVKSLLDASCWITGEMNTPANPEQIAT